ncbi:MAG: VOC family protein [Actinomycetota bacterium]
MGNDRYIPGVPCWVDTWQEEPAAAADFYAGLFGWSFEESSPPGGSIYLMAKLDGKEVAAVGEKPPGVPTTWNMYVRVFDADAAASRIGAAGGNTIMEPFDIPPFGRMGVFADADGAVFSIWQAGEFMGAAAVNSPGSWVWNDLSVPASTDARNFYGDVFGWKTHVVQAGEHSFETFVLPGYGDFLELSNPGLRKQLAEGGAPEGFEDVVAALNIQPEEGGTTGTPANWGVTISVDDTDAMAARAEQLGAKILVPPFELGPVRNAVISDPQGAVLTISKYSG